MATTPAKHDITIEQGTDYIFEFNWFDAASSPVDVTGFIFDFQIISTDGRDTVRYTGEDDMVIGGTTTFRCVIPAAITETFKSNNAYFLDYTDTNNIKSRLLNGRATTSLKREV
jgi:hypothetical protein